MSDDAERVAPRGGVAMSDDPERPTIDNRRGQCQLDLTGPDRAARHSRPCSSGSILATHGGVIRLLPRIASRHLLTTALVCAAALGCNREERHRDDHLSGAPNLGGHRMDSHGVMHTQVQVRAVVQVGESAAGTPARPGRAGRLRGRGVPRWRAHRRARGLRPRRAGGAGVLRAAHEHGPLGLGPRRGRRPDPRSAQHHHGRAADRRHLPGADLGRPPRRGRALRTSVELQGQLRRARLPGSGAL